MIKLSLQMSHITFLPIQISHAKYVVHRTQAIGLTSPPPQHRHIVLVIPISPPSLGEFTLQLLYHIDR